MTDRKQKTHEERVREMAHQIWLVEGCPEGREKAHWELAEAQVAMQEEEEQSRQHESEGDGGHAGRATGGEAELDKELADSFPASDALTTTRRESGSGAPDRPAGKKAAGGGRTAKKREE